MTGRKQSRPWLFEYLIVQGRISRNWVFRLLPIYVARLAARARHSWMHQFFQYPVVFVDPTILKNTTAIPTAMAQPEMVPGRKLAKPNSTLRFLFTALEPRRVRGR
jgi:hypothetical protein